MLVKSLYKDVAKDLGISKERVQMLYSAYWNCIKEGLKALDIHDNMGIEDEVVEAWERGESLPSKEQLEKFSEMFAIPLSTLEKSVK